MIYTRATNIYLPSIGIVLASPPSKKRTATDRRHHVKVQSHVSLPIDISNNKERTYLCVICNYNHIDTLTYLLTSTTTRKEPTFVSHN